MRLGITSVEALDDRALDDASGATLSPDSPAASGSVSYVPGPVQRLAGAWRDGLWLVLVVLTPILAYAANLAFTLLLTAAGIAGLAVVPPERRRSVGLSLLAALLAWALASQVWGYYQPGLVDLDKVKGAQQLTGLKLLFQLAFYAAAVEAMSGVRWRSANRGLTVLAVGLGVMVFVVLAEFATGEHIYLGLKAALHQKARPDLAHRNVARAFYPLALLIWPVGLHLWSKGGRWRVLAAWLAVGAAGGSVLFRVDAPMAALVVGGLSFAAVLRFGRAGILGAMTSAIAYFVLMPLVMGGPMMGRLLDAAGKSSAVAKPSWLARTDIWRFTSQLVEKRPFFGWGLDASRAFPGAIPLHPHDAALQIWLELGAVGVGLALTFFAWLFVRIDNLRRRDTAAAAAATATAMAYLVIGALSFGVWQEWWLALGALSAMVCVVLSISRRASRLTTARLSDLIPTLASR